LIRNLDQEDVLSQHEGTRRIDGKIRKVAAVESPFREHGHVIWYVTINVDCRFITLAKTVAEGAGPAGPGLWLFCDELAEQVTHFPRNEKMWWASLNDWARMSRRCALL